MTTRWPAVPRQLYSLTPQGQGLLRGRSLAEAENAVTLTTATGTLPACPARRGAGSERALPSAIPAGSDYLVFSVPSSLQSWRMCRLSYSRARAPGRARPPFGTVWRSCTRRSELWGWTGGRGRWERLKGATAKETSVARVLNLDSLLSINLLAVTGFVFCTVLTKGARAGLWMLAFNSDKQIVLRLRCHPIWDTGPGNLY